MVKSLVKGVLALAPLTMVAVMTALPGAVVFSVFVPVMFAPVAPGLVTLQVMVWLVAPEGSTVPVRVRGIPTVALAGTPEIVVTGI